MIIDYNRYNKLDRLKESVLGYISVDGAITTDDLLKLANYNGELIQPGDVIEAYTPEGFLCGQYFVTDEGAYGFMPVYRDDEFTEEKDGCVPGDLVSFTINGYMATTDGDAVNGPNRRDLGRGAGEEHFVSQVQ